MQPVDVVKIELADPDHGRWLLELLEHYALDPMGGGKALAPYARQHLVAELQAVPGYRGALALLQGEAVGLINCFTGLSTFAARPLLNIHDIVVRRDRRGQGIARALLQWAEQLARQLGCCKLTLEVLSNNQRALSVYQQAGYVPYGLQPDAGTAVLLQRLL